MRGFEHAAFADLWQARPNPYQQGSFLTDTHRRLGTGVIPASQAYRVQRASAGSRINAAGNLAFEPTDAPLFDYDLSGTRLGLRLQDRRVHKLLNTNRPDLWGTAIAAAVTPGYGTGADGTQSGFRLVADTTDATHYIGQTMSFTRGRTYSLGFNARSLGNTWLRAAFPSACFVSDRRATTFAPGGVGGTGTIAGRQNGVICDIASGPNDLRRCRMSVTANDTGTGVVTFAVNGSASASASSFKGTGAAGFLISHPWVEELESGVTLGSPLLLGSASLPREGDGLRFSVEPGNYDVLLKTDDGALSFADGLSADDEDGLLIPLPLPNGMRRVQEYWIWRADRLSRGYRSFRVPDALPAPVLALRSSTLTGASGSAVASLASVDGAPSVLTAGDPANPFTVARIGDHALLRVVPGQWGSVSGFTVADPADFTEMLAFRPAGTAPMTLIGAQDTGGALQIDYGVVPNAIRVLIYGMVCATTGPIQDDGGLIYVGFTARGTDFRSLDLNGELNVDLADVGTATFTAQGVMEMFRRAAGLQGADLFFAERTRWQPSLTRSQRARAMSEMMARTADVVVPTSFRLQAVDATETSLTVAGDVSAAIAQVRALVWADEARTTLLGASTALVPPSVAGRYVTYHPVSATVSSLPSGPGARVWYALECDGVVDPNKVQSCTLVPAHGTNRIVTCAHISCSKIKVNTVSGLFRTIAGLRPDMVIHSGDLIYANPASGDPRLYQDALSRVYRNNAEVGQVNAVSRLRRLFDDHEFADNFDPTLTYNGIPGSTIAALMKAELFQTCPTARYADSERRTLALAERMDFVSFHHMDTRLGRNRKLATVFGDPAKQPGMFDQIGWHMAQCLADVAAGMKLIVATFPTTFQVEGAGDTCWDVAPSEVTRLYDFWRDLPIPVMTRMGDAHVSYMDRGRARDRSTGLDTTIILGMASPSHHSNGQGFARDEVEFGTGLNCIRDRGRLFHLERYLPSGHVETDVYARKANDPYTQELVQQHRTADLPIVFSVADTVVAPGSTIRFEKSNQTRGAVSCDYAWSSGAASGTAGWLPNQRYARTRAPVAPMAPGTYALAVRNPVGGTVGTGSYSITVAG